MGRVIHGDQEGLAGSGGKQSLWGGDLERLRSQSGSMGKGGLVGSRRIWWRQGSWQDPVWGGGGLLSPHCDQGLFLDPDSPHSQKNTPSRKPTLQTPSASLPTLSYFNWLPALRAAERMGVGEGIGDLLQGLAGPQEQGGYPPSSGARSQRTTTSPVLGLGWVGKVQPQSQGEWLSFPSPGAALGTAQKFS